MWIVTKEDKKYPGRLREIPDPPKQLYVLGRLPEEHLPSVALIGARDCSEYGRYVALRLGELLGKNGVQVISGMARGIDGIGQEAALNAGGSSFGVLGSGVDVCYPAGNRELYERLKTQGGILSEYPPGTPALPHHFPPRNRIVSGLADAVVVVEAREKSGTLITVDMALEQGREVYAVPGRMTDRLSDGCNRLIKTGAGVLLNPEEFLEELWEIPLPEKREASGHSDPAQGSLDVLEPELRAVYEALDFAPKSLGQIRETLRDGFAKRFPQEASEGVPEKFGDRQIIAHLMRLCMENQAVQVSPGSFCVRKN